MNGGAAMWASSLRRRRLGALILLTLFIGLAGGAVLTSIEVARRTDSAIDRYLDRSGVPARTVFVCPEGVTGSEADFDPGVTCSRTDDVLATASLLRRAPQVQRAVAGRAAIVGVRSAAKKTWSPMIAMVAMDEGPTSPESILVEGRFPHVEATDEIVINEAAAEYLRVGAGSTIELGAYLADQRLEVAAQGTAGEPDGGAEPTRVVGVARTIDDIGTRTDASVFAPSGWWRAHRRDDIAGYGAVVTVALKDRHHMKDFDASLAGLLGDRIYQTDQPFESLDATRRVVEVQTAAVWVVSGVVLLAAAVFVALTVRRHVALILDDRFTVMALGARRRDVIATACLATWPAALAGAVLSAVLAMLLSPIGPVGSVRGIEAGPGIRIDSMMLLLGVICLSVAGLLIVAVSATALVRQRSDRVPTRSAVLGLRSFPVPARAALGMLRRRDSTGIAGVVAATAVAVAVVVAAFGLTASRNSLLAHPDEFGQSWDALAGNFGDPEELASGLESIEKVESAEEFAVTRSTQDTTIDGIPTYLFSFSTESKSIGPVIVRGRRPGPGEIALGATTMASTGVALGDRVHLETNAPNATPKELEVVGQAIVNDGTGYGTRLGDGALVDDSDFPDPFAIGQYLLVKAAPGVSVHQLVADLSREFGESALPAARPRDVDDLDRVAAAPWVWAGVVGGLALVALAMSIVTLLARRRIELGVLRVIGFRRRQVVMTTLAVAGWLVFPAIVVGVPLGVIATRTGWALIRSRVGFESSAPLPIHGALGAVVIVGATAAAVALVPAIRASRRSVAVDLHTE